MGEDGVYADSVENLLLKNNTVNNNPRHGINADSGSHSISIIVNNVYNNGESGILCSDASIIPWLTGIRSKITGFQDLFSQVVLKTTRQRATMLSMKKQVFL